MDSFPQFSSPRMPAELQTAIWEQIIALTPARKLPLKLRSRPYEPEGRDATLELPTVYPEYGTPRVYAYYTPHPVPAALHVCKFSRHLAMKRWTLAFGCEFITRDWDDLDEIRELCGEGKVYGNEDEEIEEDKRGTMWIDMENDTLEFDDMPVNEEEENGESGEEEEKPEEDMQITLTEFTECTDNDEREMVKRVQLNWEEIVSAAYFEHVLELTSSAQAHKNRAEAIVTCFPNLEILFIAVALLSGDTFQKWRAQLALHDKNLLTLIENVVGGEGGKVELTRLTIG